MYIHRNKEDSRNVNEALICPTKEEEYNLRREFMKSNRVWKLVYLPLIRCNAIENKRTLKMKRKTDRSVERYYAYLVAKRYIIRRNKLEGNFSIRLNFLNMANLDHEIKNEREDFIFSIDK